MTAVARTTYAAVEMDEETGAAAAGAASQREASGDDLDEATSFYERLHNAHRVALTPAGDSFSYRVRSVWDAAMTLRSSTLSANRWGRIEPEGHYLLTWAQHGTAVIDAGTDQEQVLRPGTAVMYPTGRAFTLDAPAGAVLHAVDFAADFLEGLDAARRGEEPRRLEFLRRPDPVALATLQRRLAVAAPELLRPDTDPVRRALLTESLGNLLLDTFVEPVGDLVRQYPGAVGRALQFIVDRAADPVTTADIAAAAGLSARGLQQAFVRADLPTPMVALRQERLRHVREALQHAEPGTATVATIATAWSFGHLGRFSGYYEREFGELPSATLRDRS
ncbi:helix-turn-helix domain-containing protein [Curtobacterium sp. NPDC098951]|uniref:helix-turn-helix domain-containing protein n=1 Tax=Curtobacterium sp. NPDC098951 TaxID=3363974 RepID=UPI0038006446